MHYKLLASEIQSGFTNTFPTILFDLKLKAISMIVKLFVEQSERQGFTLDEILQGFSALAHERGLSRTSFFLDEASYESARVRKKQKLKKEPKCSTPL